MEREKLGYEVHEAYVVVTMPSKQQDVASTISPVLFMSVDGEPMSFFLRPGPVKSKLQPLINAGGGVMCNVQQPEAILLIDPEEGSSVHASTVHRYVSTKYIDDCIEKEEQLNLEDYRLNPDVVQRQSTRLNSSSARLSGGRVPYTSEEDAAILNYVSKRKTETGGNRLWQEMEKQRVTTHSWQSMKSRYKDQLAKKQVGVVEVETAEEEDKAAEKTEVETNQEIDDQKPSSETDVAPIQTHAAESDLTQISVPSILAESTLANVNPQTSNCLIDEEEKKQQMDESEQSEIVGAETSHSLQTDEPSAELETADTTDPDRDGPGTTLSPQKQTPEMEALSAQPESSAKTASSNTQMEKQKASDSPEQPQRRVTRRQLELGAPEPYGKKLRSSSSSVTQLASSPQSTKKTKSVGKSAQKDTTDQPPSKRTKGKILEAMAESQNQPEQSDHNASSEPAPPDEADTAPQKAEKKKGKRQLGILELATKEFEDESESDEDDPPDLQTHTETAGASTEALPTPTNIEADPASAQCIPETGPSPQEDVQGSQASSVNCVPDTSSPDPAAAEPAFPEPDGATPKPHMFIFESESQEEDSQSVEGNPSAALQSSLRPSVNKDGGLSLTQMQLEEDKQQIRELMKQTDQDLASVTKALLKTSGDFSLALDLLLNPSLTVPVWNRHDDSLLLSADPAVRQHLQEKYGEESVAKRMVFLEVEG